MKIIELLKEKMPIFVVDDIETKKVQILINNANQNFLDMAQTIEGFKDYKSSQLKGDLHTRIVMVKSLAEEYFNWQAVQDVLAVEESKQTEKIMEYDAQKTKLINSFKSLLIESKNSPIVSLYDLYDQDYQLCNKDHEVIILGNHNREIIEHAIEEFEERLVANGNFDEISGITLQANYSTVMQNAELCNYKLDSGIIKAAKVPKIRQAVEEMIDVAKKVVMFVTYKNTLVDIGVKPKEMQNKEKMLTKQYIPLKKFLQKELGVNFADICDVVVNEDLFAPIK